MKTISSSARHLHKLDDRRPRLRALLTRAPRAHDMPASASIRMAAHVPEATDIGIDLPGALTILPENEVRRLLRSQEAATHWVEGDVDLWLRQSHQALRSTYLRNRQSIAGQIDEAIQRSLQQLALDWPDLAEQYLHSQLRLHQPGRDVCTLIYCSGRLGELAYQAFSGLPEAILIRCDLGHDEILLCTVERGLTAHDVTRHA